MVFLFQVEAAGECNGPAPDEARRLLEEEFNVQRAKMKELFLQKEGSLSVISSVGCAGYRRLGSGLWKCMKLQLFT